MSNTDAAQTGAASIKPHTGKLGIMIPGMGAVATTLIAGVEAVRRGICEAVRLADADGHDPSRASATKIARRW